MSWGDRNGLPGAVSLLPACALAGGLLLGLLPLIARADGSLPALPYRYLHPPAALAAGNRPPLAGVRTVPIVSGYAGNTFAFTTDGQAGVTGLRNAIRTRVPGISVRFAIQPTETPSGLVSNLAVDGNAYHISITSQPGGHPITIVRALKLTLRWPHLPFGIYAFRGGVWSPLCFSASATLTSSTITCSLRHTSIVAAVAPPITLGAGSAPNLKGTPFSALTPYLAFIATAAVLLFVVALMFFIGRDNQREETSKHG